jgi:predicted TIM-barrel fold metal-dependent hydrolase
MNGALRIIDTDTHIIDPPDIWVDRMSRAKWGDDIPHVAWSDEMDREMWFIGDEPLYPAWSSAMRGGVPGLNAGPASQADVHPSCYDAGARLKGMDANGIAVEVLYPNLGLTGDVVPGRPRELALELIRVRNDWQLDWVSVAPSRFVPLACIPYWDVEAAVKEIERCAEAGHAGVIMTAAPELHGQPVFGHPRWDPLWAAIQAHDLPVSFHIATGDPMANFGSERAELEGAATSMARGSCLTFTDNCKYMINLMFSGVLPKYPGLKFVTVESGISWIPFALDAADYMFSKAQGWRENPEYEMLPSEYFRRQVWANYWFERIEDHHIERIGADRILFETDFPHPCCLVGDEISNTIDFTLETQPPHVRERILWRNAAELFKRTDLLESGNGN